MWTKKKSHVLLLLKNIVKKTTFYSKNNRPLHQCNNSDAAVQLSYKRGSHLMDPQGELHNSSAEPLNSSVEPLLGSSV